MVSGKRARKWLFCSEIVTKLTDHLNAKQKKTAESVIIYMAALHHLAEDCKYGTFFEEALRDKFLWGLANEGIKMKLLEEKKSDVNIFWRKLDEQVNKPSSALSWIWGVKTEEFK